MLCRGITEGRRRCSACSAFWRNDREVPRDSGRPEPASTTGSRWRWQRSSGAFDGEALDNARAAIVLRIEDGRFTGIWSHHYDQAEMDQLWS